MTSVPELMSWQCLTAIVNSAFMQSLVGALAGAYAGAYAAQKFAEDGRVRAEFEAQIRNTNAAITLSVMIFNTAFSFKSQETKGLCDEYFKKKSELENSLGNTKAGEISPAISFEYLRDFRRFTYPSVPIGGLRSIAFEKLSVSARPLALVVALDGSLSSLADTIAKRNELIASFKALKASAQDTAALYFGLPYHDGHVKNTEYLDTMTGLQAQTDDVVKFSQLLCNDLATHGNKVLAKFKSQCKRVHEQIHAIEWPDKNAELVPSDERYSEWLNGFRERK